MAGEAPDSAADAAAARTPFLEHQLITLHEAYGTLLDQVAALEKDKDRLAQENARLSALVMELNEKLGRNSTNSHLPPSSDGPGAQSRQVRRAQRRSERKRGGQKGHQGAFRALVAPEAVDTVVDLFPEVCLGCAEALPKVIDQDPSRTQQLDLMDHRPHITEWRRHEVTCARCGARTRAEAGRDRIPSSAFGPTLTAVVVLLTGTYHLSRRKTQRLLQELFGIHISVGTISTLEHRMSEVLKPAYEEAKTQVEDALVKHADATSWLQSGNLLSLWTLASASATVYGILKDGRQETVRAFFGRCRGILVSDRASVFSFWSMYARQICWAHLLRKFISFSERDGPVKRFGEALREYTVLIFSYWHRFREGRLGRNELQAWMRPVQVFFEKTVDAARKSEHKGLSGSCEDLWAHRSAWWTFLTEEGVEPTNNHAEQELRSLVLWRKRSFGSRSERGDRFVERIMTVTQTARKQGRGVLAFLVSSLRSALSSTPAPTLIAV